MSLQRTLVRLVRSVGIVVGFLLVTDGLSSHAFAQVTAVPEIDPGSAASALTLLFGGLLLLAHRGRRT
jgi:hypothetical protein